MMSHWSRSDSVVVVLVVVVAIIAGLFALSAAWADDPPCVVPEACEQCSADPAFIQRDMRDISTVLFLRAAKTRGATVVEGRTFVFAIEQQEKGDDNRLPVEMRNRSGR